MAHPQYKDSVSPVLIPGKERGASMPLVIVFLAMASVIFTLTFKLYPAFYENWQIKNVIESLADVSGLADLSADEIQTLFEKRLSTESIRGFDTEANLIIEGDESSVFIGVDYEVRISIYKNIDAVVKFNESIEKSF